MQNWYNIAQVFLINYPEVWMALLIAFAAALTMRSDIFATAGRYCIGIAVLIGAGYLVVDIFNL
jgi:hypothetical protein